MKKYAKYLTLLAFATAAFALFYKKGESPSAPIAVAENPNIEIKSSRTPAANAKDKKLPEKKVVTKYSESPRKNEGVKVHVVPEKKQIEEKVAAEPAPAIEASKPATKNDIAESPVVAPEKPKNEPSDFNVLEVELHTYFSRFEATDTTTGSTATLFTNMNMDLSLGWKQNWNKTTQTEIFLGASSTSFVQPSGSAKTIANANLSTSFLGIGGEYSFSQDFSVASKLLTKQELFLAGASPTSIAIDKVQVTELDLSAKYNLLDRGSLTLGVLGGVTYLSSSKMDSYTIKSGSILNAEIFVKDTGRTLDLKGGFFYQQQNQNTSISNQSSMHYGISLGLDWRWGLGD